MSNLSVAHPFSRSKTSRNIQYERWTAVPYRHPKEKKSLTASEMVVYDFFTYCVGTNPHLDQELSILHKNSSVFFMQFTIFTLQ